MAEWLVEAGIGETRAALIEDGAIVAARIERDVPGLRAGTVAQARLVRITVPGRRGIVSVAGHEAVLEPLPRDVPEGGRLTVAIVREAIPEAGRPKPPRARAAVDAAEVAGPDLMAQLVASGLPVRMLAAHEPDALEAAGWSEVLEAAIGCEIDFGGGALRLSLTPAMTLFDVDGLLPPAGLAVAGARAAAQAIRRLDIGGSIGIDLPTLGDKAARQAAAAEIDRWLPQPYERTAVNGFGFLQIVRRRVRASLPELLAADPTLAAALALLRQAERARGAGLRTLVAAPAVIAPIAARDDWQAALAARTGAAVALRPDARLAISAGYVETQHPPPRA